MSAFTKLANRQPVSSKHSTNMQLVEASVDVDVRDPCTGRVHVRTASDHTKVKCLTSVLVWSVVGGCSLCLVGVAKDARLPGS